MGTDDMREVRFFLRVIGINNALIYLFLLIFSFVRIMTCQSNDFELALSDVKKKIELKKKVETLNKK